MPHTKSHIDAVGGAKVINVCDVQNIYWQIPTAIKYHHKTVFVTTKGKYVFKSLPFVIANVAWVFERVMSLALVNFGKRTDLLVHMDDSMACSST